MHVVRFLGTAVVIGLLGLVIVGIIDRSPVHSGAAQAATRTPTPQRSKAIYVDPRLLTSDSESYLGVNLYIQGEALTVQHEDTYTWVQVMAQIRGENQFATESVVVYLEPPVKTLLSDECYRFFGVGAGSVTMTLRLTGSEVETPLLYGYAYAPSAEADYRCVSP